MSISTDKSGVACCGSCGAQLAIVCTAGCAEPDVVFRDDYIASLKVPKVEEKKRPERIPKPPREPKPKKVAKYPPPTHCWCGDPVAKRERGRPPTKCEKHMPPSRAKGAIAA